MSKTAKFHSLACLTVLQFIQRCGDVLKHTNRCCFCTTEDKLGWTAQIVRALPIPDHYEVYKADISMPISNDGFWLVVIDVSKAEATEALCSTLTKLHSLAAAFTEHTPTKDTVQQTHPRRTTFQKQKAHSPISSCTTGSLCTMLNVFADLQSQVLKQTDSLDGCQTLPTCLETVCLLPLLLTARLANLPILLQEQSCKRSSGILRLLCGTEYGTTDPVAAGQSQLQHAKQV